MVMSTFTGEIEMQLPIHEYLELKNTTGWHLAKSLSISPSRVGHWVRKDSGAQTMIHFNKKGITHVSRDLTVWPRPQLNGE